MCSTWSAMGADCTGLLSGSPVRVWLVGFCEPLRLDERSLAGQVRGDGLLFGNIFHDWDFESCCLLARKSFQALKPGGSICLHEMLLKHRADKNEQTFFQERQG